jgi:phage tail tape-measure protein
LNPNEVKMVINKIMMVSMPAALVIKPHRDGTEYSIKGSKKGALKGATTGAMIGSKLGPVGLAAGILAGGTLGYVLGESD